MTRTSIESAAESDYVKLFAFPGGDVEIVVTFKGERIIGKIASNSMVAASQVRHLARTVAIRLAIVCYWTLLTGIGMEKLHLPSLGDCSLRLRHQENRLFHLEWLRFACPASNHTLTIRWHSRRAYRSSIIRYC